MFRRTLAAVVITASLSPADASLFVGYDVESDEERRRRQSLRLTAIHTPAPPPATDLPAPAGPTP